MVCYHTSKARERNLISNRSLRRIKDMFEIITKKMLGPKVFLMEIKAPMVAKKAMPGLLITIQAYARA